YFDTEGNRLRHPDVRAVPQLTGADGVDTTFFGGSDPDGTGFQNFFGTSAAAPDVAAVGALVLQAAGGSGSLAPHALYSRLQETASPIALPDDRSIASATAGPVMLLMNGEDWVRSNTYFQLSVGSDSKHFVSSITFDATKPGLTWSTNPNRFSIGDTNSVQITDVTATVNGFVWTLQFAPGSFGRGDEFTFGMSVFAPIEGSTQEDPDRFRGMTMTVVMDDGRTFKGKVTADEPQKQNRYTGFGLVNAAKAIKNH
ncbi:MAG TPA: S8 family serine peptidase, partial [Steroidobacteraceae bacterium]|nr:S8 family serine peptidase [Steroidobacteraceae bacterium]